MKDFISKVTFGFLMAQLFPGATVVFAIACVHADRHRTYGGSLWRTISEAGSFLFSDAFTTVVFVLLATGVGMCIHGLHWAVLAWLEHVTGQRGWKSLRGDLWWHRWPIWLQLLLSPLCMLIEVLWLVRYAKLDDLIMEENVASVSKDKMEQFNFLQDFYLHFGQFFAHMAYALLFTTICAGVCYVSRRDTSRGELVSISYLLTSVLFLLGRIHLGSLFWAETCLVRGGPSGVAEPERPRAKTDEPKPLAGDKTPCTDQPTQSASGSPM